MKTQPFAATIQNLEEKQAKLLEVIDGDIHKSIFLTDVYFKACREYTELQLLITELKNWPIPK